MPPDVAREQVLSVVREGDQCSFDEVVIRVVQTHFGKKYLTSDALDLCRRLDFSIRDILWDLLESGELQMTPRRHVYRRGDARK